MRLHSLDDVVRLTLTTLTFPSFHPLAGQTGVVNAFAIRHPAGVVLVDTGVGEGNEFIEREYRPQRTDVGDALRAAGLALGDVVAVVNGHLHFDNVGSNRLFPGVPIFVQRAEWDLARAGVTGYRSTRVEFDVLSWIDFPAADYRIVDDEHEILPGIRVMSTPGHTPGHQAVVVETGEGLALVAGQVPYDRDEWEWIRAAPPLPEWPSERRDQLTQNVVAGEPETYLSSVTRLIALDPRRVHFTHDPVGWNATTCSARVRSPRAGG